MRQAQTSPTQHPAIDDVDHGDEPAAASKLRFEGDFCARKGGPGQHLWVAFAVHFRPKIRKGFLKKHAKLDTEDVLKNP